MRRFLILTFLILTLKTNIYAGCTACRELKYVQVTFQDGNKTDCYIKWNNQWFAWLENPEIKISETFPENMTEFYKIWKNGKAEIEVFKNIYRIGNENWGGIFTTHDDIIKTTFDKIKSIVKIENRIDNLHRAQNLSVFSKESLKYLDQNPTHIKKYHDTGCDFDILNFNDRIDEKEFELMIDNGDFYSKENELESQGILVIRNCFD